MRFLVLIATFFVLFRAQAANELAPRSVTLCASVVLASQRLSAESEKTYLVSFNDFTNRVNSMVKSLFDGENPLAFRNKNVWRTDYLKSIEKEDEAQLTSDMMPTRRELRELGKTQGRLFGLKQQLAHTPRGMVITIREVEGTENILSFLDQIEGLHADLKEQVEASLQKQGFDSSLAARQKINREATLGIPLVMINPIFLLSAPLEFSSGQYGASAISLVLATGTAWSAIKRLPSVWRRIQLTVGGQLGANALIAAENELSVRANSLYKFVDMVREGLSSGRAGQNDFAYFGYNVPITAPLYQVLVQAEGRPLLNTGVVSNSVIEQANNIAGVPAIGAIEGEVGIDLILQIDESGQPRLLVLNRIVRGEIPQQKIYPKKPKPRKSKLKWSPEPGLAPVKAGI